MRLPPRDTGSYLGTKRETRVRGPPAPGLAPAPHWPLPLTGSPGPLALLGQSHWALEAAPGPGHCQEEGTRGGHALCTQRRPPP